MSRQKRVREQAPVLCLPVAIGAMTVLAALVRAGLAGVFLLTLQLGRM